MAELVGLVGGQPKAGGGRLGSPVDGLNMTGISVFGKENGEWSSCVPM